MSIELCRQIGFTEPGGPEVMRIVEAGIPKPGRDEVLIQVQAAGVNRADLLQRAGHYPPPPDASPVLGLEVSGVISALGEGVSGWKEGDAVCALVHGGGYAEYAVAHALHCLPIPNGLAVIEAAALPEAAFTIWTGIFDRGALQAGQTVLVHGGTSGIGTSAIQICAAYGARVLTTAGSEQKCAVCRSLGAELAINYREEDFVAAALEATQGRGVDVVLDMVGGSYTNRNLQALGPGGRIVQISWQGGQKPEIDLAVLMRKGAWLTGSHLRPKTVEEKAEIASALRGKIWPLYESHSIHPVIQAIFPLEDAALAHMELASEAHIGKVLLTMARDRTSTMN